MIISKKKSGCVTAPANPCTKRIPGNSSPVYAALFIFSWLLFGSPVFAQAEKSYYLNIEPGYGWHAGGAIIEKSSSGLKLVEAGVNTGILYSPGYSELVNTIGPIYQIPPIKLEVRSFKLGLSRYFGSFEYGLKVGYYDIVGFIDVPDSAINFNYFDKTGSSQLANQYYPVTSSGGQRTFATDLFLEFTGAYHTNVNDGFDLFPGFGIGGGRGWLGGFGSGPYLNEAHGLVSLGIGYRRSNVLTYLKFEEIIYLIKTAPTSFIDRRKVLVNPRKGDLQIGQLQLGISIPVL